MVQLVWTQHWRYNLMRVKETDDVIIKKGESYTAFEANSRLIPLISKAEQVFNKQNSMIIFICITYNNTIQYYYI